MCFIIFVAPFYRPRIKTRMSVMWLLWSVQARTLMTSRAAHASVFSSLSWSVDQMGSFFSSLEACWGYKAPLYATVQRNAQSGSLELSLVLLYSSVGVGKVSLNIRLWLDEYLLNSWIIFLNPYSCNPLQMERKCEKCLKACKRKLFLYSRFLPFYKGSDDVTHVYGVKLNDCLYVQQIQTSVAWKLGAYGWGGLPLWGSAGSQGRKMQQLLRSLRNRTMNQWRETHVPLHHRRPNAVGPCCIFFFQCLTWGKK